MIVPFCVCLKIQIERLDILNQISLNSRNKSKLKYKLVILLLLL